MIILALDTTGNVASVAIVDEHITIAEFTTNFKKNHSTTIMPMLEHMLEEVSMSLNRIDYIACSSGPGSFTGLKIGVATAKALAHGSGKKIISVPTLDALAYNVFDTAKIIVPIMDARRNQCYTAFYQWQGHRLSRITDYIADDIEEIIIKAKGYEHVIFTGDGAITYKDVLEWHRLVSAPSHINMQRASAVGRLALELAKENKFVDYREFKPFYLRKPQAEREYERKNAAD